MTYDKIIKFPTSRTYQCCAGNNREEGLRLGSSKRNGRPIRDVQTASLSVYKGSKGYRKKDNDSGAKDGLYGQAIPEACSIATTICKMQENIFEPNRDSGSRSFSSEWAEAWLRSEVRSSEGLNWNMSLIDYTAQKLRKLTGYWYRRKFGPGIVQRDLQTRDE